MNSESSYYPPEWHEQEAIQIIWPNRSTDWRDNLDEVLASYRNMAIEISMRQKLIVVCQSVSDFDIELNENIQLVEAEYNDTWARDSSGISVVENGKMTLLDFTFNGWGNKFESGLDNKLTRTLFSNNVFQNKILNTIDFVLEGGSIESDGNGVVMTTSSCLLNENRNVGYSKNEIEILLKENLHVQKVLWLDHGYVKGDDTDGHIDTLARFCDEKTIVYQDCADKKMVNQLKSFTNVDGEVYECIELPRAEIPDLVRDDEEYDKSTNIEGSYANFVILNGAVLVPEYGLQQDQEAQDIISNLFPKREIIGITALPFIKEGGSLHCLTMHYPLAKS